MSINCQDPGDNPIDIPHDCINGACIPSSNYNTPGKYANFANCQAGCATNARCSGECIPPSELSALRKAAYKLCTKYCK